MKVVFYSLSGACDAMRVTQFQQSVRSLRRHNPNIAIYLVLYGSAPQRLHVEADRWDVRIQQAGDYRERLEHTHPYGGLLAANPTFHKLLSLRHLPLAHASQILYLDGDTFFFQNVDRLFADHTEAHWFAREEPYSRRSPLGYDAAYVDETQLSALAEGHGLSPVSPCNTGVCLLNHGVWWRLIELETVFLDLAWRLTLGIHLRARQAGKSAPGPTLVAEDRQWERALPFPSSNLWILEQVALWLTLGHIPGFMQGFFPRNQVMQADESLHNARARDRSVVAHYFSNGMSRFFADVSPLPRR